MCFGPFARVCHWGPLTAIGIIKIVTAMTMHCTSMWWPRDTLGGKVNSAVFIGLSGMTIYNFLSSMYHGPGYLQLKWVPKDESECKYLQFCNFCQGYKAPRSHHCRKCDRCVLKMDHHCPWINNCIGWGNHAHFSLFLMFATLGCTHASIILGSSLYRSIHRIHYIYYGTGSEPIVFLGVYGMILCVLALGLSIGVVTAVGMLFYFQLRAIIRNRTGIEDWILEKANARRRNTNSTFEYPYDIGLWNNICQVINFSCRPVGDGIYWPVKDGCDQYTLTKEQLEQKSEKRLKSKVYSIVKPASGYWFPITQGFRVCLNYPFTDEPRIKLDIGDIVVVSRWRKHWLFGEKIHRNHSSSDQSRQMRIRGWFPRRCAVEHIDGSEQGTNHHSIPKNNFNKKIQ